ncbi:MAG: hypothetical protein HKN20_13275 [Gemmatimonadetes bacterium]|nr:hypothetical protein [Gemmatimonadota bacterium]
MLKSAFKILGLSAVVHIGIISAAPHISHKMLTMKIREILKDNRGRSDVYIRNEIVKYASDKNMQVESDEIRVWNQNGIKIYIDYTHEVKVPFKPYEVELKFALPPNVNPPGINTRRRR